MCSTSGGGIDFIQSSLDECPFCSHGPTIKFERFYSATKSKQSTQFYACAVYRSRKECSFYHPVQTSISSEKHEQYYKHFIVYQQNLLSSCVDGAVDIVRGLDQDKRCMCKTCGILITNEAMMTDKHTQHNIIYGLSDQQLSTPTNLLRPQDDNKGQAQYFFSSASRNLILSEIERLKKTHVICLGVPRLHEELVRTGKSRSFLLDIDHRFVQFYSSDSFQRYNMFNGFFYSNDEGLQSLEAFIKSSSKPKDIILLCDPPFGGLLTALKTGIKRIWSIAESELHTLLVFPYFNEHHVIESFPTFHMLDYQVTYEGHPHFNNKHKKRPSPVRVYTNLPLPGLKLPHTEGYSLCKECNRYVHSNNKHCKQCNKCTSKDGRPYKHCDVCSICVKQSYVHCERCGLCVLHTHDCGKKVPMVGCHVCGSMDHKRRDCPSRGGTGSKGDRSLPPSRKRRRNVKKKTCKRFKKS